jgi:hypothetical protein
MSNLDYNQRAARGQALNLAVSRSIADGKADDKEYIKAMFLFYLDLSNEVQELDLSTVSVRTKI